MGFPGKNSRGGCHSLLQGIFPTRGSNPDLLHWQAESLPLSHHGSPSHNSHVLLALKFIDTSTAVLGNLPPYENIYLPTNILLPFIWQLCTNELTIFVDILFLFLRKVSYFLAKKRIPFLGYSIKNIFVCKTAVSLLFLILSFKSVTFGVPKSWRQAGIVISEIETEKSRGQICTLLRSGRVRWDRNHSVYSGLARSLLSAHDFCTLFTNLKSLIGAKNKPSLEGRLRGRMRTDST